MDKIGPPKPAVPQGFVLPEHARKAFSSRMMLQAPSGLTPDQIARVRRDLDSVVKGIPQDVFMVLDSLRLLADQGNLLARDLFDHESARLGLTRPFSTFPGFRPHHHD